MKAKDIMTAPVVSVLSDTTVQEIAEILLQRKISGVPVLDAENRVIGIVSEGDLIRRPEMGTERHRSWWLRLFADSEDQAREYVKTFGRKAKDVMTTSVVTVDEDASISKVVDLLEHHRIKRVPVVRNGTLVGILSRANLLRGLVAARDTTKEPTRDDRELRARVIEAINKIGVSRTFINVIVSEGRIQVWGSSESQAEQEALRVAVESVVPADRVDFRVAVLSRTMRGRL